MRTIHEINAHLQAQLRTLQCAKRPRISPLDLALDIHAPGQLGLMSPKQLGLLQFKKTSFTSISDHGHAGLHELRELGTATSEGASGRVQPLETGAMPESVDELKKRKTDFVVFALRDASQWE